MSRSQHGGWRKSTRSASSGNGDCVEVKCFHVAEKIGVRDSKQPTFHLTVDADTWSGLIAGVKDGSIS